MPTLLPTSDAALFCLVCACWLGGGEGRGETRLMRLMSDGPVSPLLSSVVTHPYILKVLPLLQQAIFSFFISTFHFFFSYFIMKALKCKTLRVDVLNTNYQECIIIGTLRNATCIHKITALHCTPTCSCSKGQWRRQRGGGLWGLEPPPPSSSAIVGVAVSTLWILHYTALTYIWAIHFSCRNPYLSALEVWRCTRTRASEFLYTIIV